MDDRMSLKDLSLFFCDRPGWRCLTLVAPNGGLVPLMVKNGVGPGVWVISGIHGEEPSGPQAIAKRLDVLDAYTFPIVLLPLLNSAGYATGLRFGGLEHSVGDMSHLLRCNTPPVSQTNLWLGETIILLQGLYPPVLVVDLHEDDTVDGNYLFFVGDNTGVATLAAGILEKTGFPLHWGEVIGRPGGRVFGPIVVNELDSSIDELLEAAHVYVWLTFSRWKDRCPAVLTVETAARQPMGYRTFAHGRILCELDALRREAMRV